MYNVKHKNYVQYTFAISVIYFRNESSKNSTTSSGKFKIEIS